MTQDYLTKIIVNAYASKDIETFVGKSGRLCAKPLVDLCPSQEQSLLEGDGQGKFSDAYKQINSSTGLAVNYFKLAEENKKVTMLNFEVKVGVPLSIVKGNRNANLDVSFRDSQKRKIFVESKYLEPYYIDLKNPKCHNGEAYIKDTYRYPKEINEHFINDWIDLFKRGNTYEVYDAPQLCRHLLAIYRYSYIHNHADKIVLLSLTWDVTKSFLQEVNNIAKKRELKKRLRKLKEEKVRFMEDFLILKEKIGWRNMSFETKSYNDGDMLNAIKTSSQFKEFLKRYFLD